MAFATRRFLKDFSPSVAGLVTALADYGYEPPLIRTVYQWQNRDSIPSGYLLAMLFIRELESRPARISDYMRRE